MNALRFNSSIRIYGLALMIFFVASAFPLLAQTIVSGSVSGTWTMAGSPYVATDNIYLNGPLIIEAGVHVQFQAGGYIFDISGNKFMANGTAENPIVFEPWQGSLPGSWQGILALNNSQADTLNYCVIKNAVDAVTVDTRANGSRPPVVLNHCDIFDNSNIGLSSYVNTGHATAAVAQLYVYDSDIHHNGLHGATIWEGAVGSGTAWLILERCNIYANQGYGVHQIRNNTHVRINNCTIVGNHGDGLNLSADSEVINTIIAFNQGYGINEENPAAHFEPNDIIYNCLWENGLGNYHNLSSSGFGYPVTTNINGDSSDINFNLYLDPGLSDTSIYDFSLDSLSVCIDAGSSIVNGQFITDPDGTLPDIGANYYNQYPITGILSINQLPFTFKLEQNYPNPFNPSTTIGFTIPVSHNNQIAELSIYNALGQKIITLQNGKLRSGQYNKVWSGRDQFDQPVASGIYVYMLRVGNQLTKTKKMLLVK